MKSSGETRDSGFQHLRWLGGKEGRSDYSKPQDDRWFQALNSRRISCFLLQTVGCTEQTPSPRAWVPVDLE